MDNRLNLRADRGFCKKDYKNETNSKFENYLNNRENNNDLNNNVIPQNIEKKKIEYNKDEFLQEFMILHNDMYFNPYKILEIDKNYTLDELKSKYKEMAFKFHPDKGGDTEIFKEITQSYIYLLKKYKENIPDKQIYELKEDFNDFMNQPKKKNILMKNNNFDLNNFNNIFENNTCRELKGHGDFMKTGINETKKDTYVFSDKFNISIFNKIFNQTTKKIDKQQIQVYKEPSTIFQSNSGYSELDGDDKEDFTSGFTFNQKMHFTDCKKAYSEPEAMMDSLESFNNLEELEKHRSNISYDMNEEDLDKYNKYLEFKKLQEIEKKKKIERNDLNILKQYNKFNNILLEN